MSRMSLRVVAAGIAAGIAFSAAPQDAEAQSTFTACRVPDVGAIYMIGVAGAPSACLDVSHVEFSWTEGGATVADGSITTVKLADDAVTSAKIADGTIIGADMVGGTVGTAEIALNAITSALLATDAVTGVAIATDAVGSTEILDGAVTQVDVDLSEIQARVDFVCAVGSAIQSIAQDGSITCQSSSGNVAGFQEGFASSVTLSSTAPVELGSLSLPGSSSGLATVVAHAYAEKDPLTTGRYEYTVRIGDCTGTSIGLTLWRPLVGTAGLEAVTTTVTGFTGGITGPTTIVLCGRKFDGSAPDATVYARGMVAQW